MTLSLLATIATSFDGPLQTFTQEEQCYWPRSPEYDHFEVIAPCFIDPRAPSGLSLPSPVPAHSSYGVSYHGHDTRPIHCPQSQAETPATTDSRPPTLSTEEVDGMSIEELERYAAVRHVRYRKVWEREQKEMLKLWRSENEARR